MKLGDGSTEVLKWLAVVAMTCDHVNKYLFNSTLPYLFEVGRIALPLFVFVLAYNLARPESLTKAVYRRIAARLGGFAALAAIPYILLGTGVEYGWWPLNVLFTLLLTSAVIYFLNYGGVFGFAVSALIFSVGGAVVEFLWIAVAMGAATWVAIRFNSYFSALIAVSCCFALGLVNGNYWAAMAIPFIGLAVLVDVDCRRYKYFFYAYYPLHLTILLLIRIPMGKAGYSFMGA